MKLTIRLRLTLLYGGMFLFAGAVLLALNYALVRSNLTRRPFTQRILIGVDGRVTQPPADRLEPLAGPGARPPFTEEEMGRVRAAVQQVERKVRDAALSTLVVQSVSALGLMSVASVGLGYVAAGRALRPLHDITDTARRLGEQNLHERIALHGPKDELKELADTFDDMLGRLDAAFDSQRRFVANASHELRTPLAVIRTEADVALSDPDASVEQLREMAVAVRDAVDRSERLVESLLLLARSDRGVAERAPVDLAAVAGEVVTQAAGSVRRAGLDVRLDLEPAPVRGDGALLDRLVANLVENAVRYNYSGGWVSVATTVVDGQARLVVANTGPVVPPGDAEQLFEPFRRGDGVRGAGAGVGLGLSIVRSVASAHGGRAVLRSRAGGGLEVEVRIPVSP